MASHKKKFSTFFLIGTNSSHIFFCRPSQKCPNFREKKFFFTKVSFGNKMYIISGRWASSCLMMGVPTYPGRRKPTNDNQLLTAVNSSNNIESMVIILHLLASSILSCMYVPTLDAQRPEMIYTLFPKITQRRKKIIKKKQNWKKMKMTWN